MTGDLNADFGHCPIYIHGEATTISHFSFGPSFRPRSRGGTPQGLTLFLLILLSGNKDRIAAEAPVFQRYFINGDDSRSRIFVQDVGQKIRDTTDERSFLLGGEGAPKGRIGYWRYERERGNASQVRRL